MKKMFFLCLCGMGFMLEGVDVENARCKNIEAARTTGERPRKEL